MQIKYRFLKLEQESTLHKNKKAYSYMPYRFKKIIIKFNRKYTTPQHTPSYTHTPHLAHQLLQS